MPTCLFHERSELVADEVNTEQPLVGRLCSASKLRFLELLIQPRTRAHEQEEEEEEARRAGEAMKKTEEWAREFRFSENI